MKRVLFVCLENACRSQMAEAVARAMAAGAPLEFYSAGSRPSGSVNPGTQACMAEAGYELKGHRSKGLDQVPDGVYDALVTMGCGDACPAVRAKLRRDWDIPDPRDMDAAGFHRVRRRIEREVRELLAELAS